jgi:hypothetical protein
LDVKNRLETKHQNIRERKTYELTAKILDRSAQILQKEHEREIRIIKNGIQDLYIKTPYFQSFWPVNRRFGSGQHDLEEVRAAVIDRVLGRKRQSTVETIGENEVLDKSIDTSVFESNNEEPEPLEFERFGNVRRIKSEPSFPSAADFGVENGASLSTEQSESSRLTPEEVKPIDKKSVFTHSYLPIILDTHNSNRDLAKYQAYVCSKRNTRSKKRKVVVAQKSDITNHRTRNIMKRAENQYQALDGLYHKRSLPKKKPEEVEADETDVQSRLRYVALPTNDILRAHFLSQTNSRRYFSQ